MNTESESFELTVSKSQMVLNRLTEFACVCVCGGVRAVCMLLHFFVQQVQCHL